MCVRTYMLVYNIVITLEFRRVEILFSLLKKLLFTTHVQQQLFQNRRHWACSDIFVNITIILKPVFTKPFLNNVKQKWFLRDCLCLSLNLKFFKKIESDESSHFACSLIFPMHRSLLLFICVFSTLWLSSQSIFIPQ